MDALTINAVDAAGRAVMSEVKREHLAGLELARNMLPRQSMKNHIKELDSLIAQASAAPEHSLFEMVKDLAEEAHGNGNSWADWAKPRMDAIVSALRSAAPERGPVMWANGERLKSFAEATFYEPGDPKTISGCSKKTNYCDTPLYTHADTSEVERLRAENKRLLSAGQALEADFSSYRREVEHKAEASTQRADAAEQKLGEAQGLLGEIDKFLSCLPIIPSRAITIVYRIRDLLPASAEPAEVKP